MLARGKIDNFQIKDKYFFLEESPFLYAKARLKIGTTKEVDER